MSWDIYFISLVVWVVGGRVREQTQKREKLYNKLEIINGKTQQTQLNGAPGVKQQNHDLCNL